MEYVFAARFEHDPEGGYLVTFPDVPEAITGGATMADARSNAAEALGLALRGIVGLGRCPPRRRGVRTFTRSRSSLMWR